MAEVPTEHLQLQYIRAALSSIMAPPKGHKITRIRIWQDNNGNLKEFKAYDGESLLFTLTNTKAGSGSTEVLDLARTEP